MKFEGRNICAFSACGKYLPIFCVCTLDQTLTFKQHILNTSKTEESVQSVTISLLMRQKQSCVLLFCHGLIIATVVWLAQLSIYAANSRKSEQHSPSSLPVIKT